MGKAALVIMAAGVGSRYSGGIKQLEPVGPNKEVIMDYSVYDAIQAGFDKVVFVIRKELEPYFREMVSDKIEQLVEVQYAYQELEDIPKAYQEKAVNRKKPWGTGQAILCCKELVKEPFLVINADDYYGKEAYEKAFAYLTETKKENEICMVGFILGNTLSENGAVTRGVCSADKAGMLESIEELKGIENVEGQAIIKETGRQLELSSPVSMNMWGLNPEFFKILEVGFESFLSVLEQDSTQEYLLPIIIGELLQKGLLSVKMLQSSDKWFGVTYKEDKESVIAEIEKLIKGGSYPEKLY